MPALQSNGRAFVIAQTGGGKTTLVAYLTLQVRHLAVYDVKRELGWLPNSTVVTDVNKMTWRRREVFQPPVGREGDVDLFDAWCCAAYHAGAVMVWLDEASFVTTPNKISPWLRSILIAGRSRGVGCIALSQSSIALSHPLLWRGAEDVYLGYMTTRATRDVVKEIGQSAERAGQIKQYSGEFLAYIDNAKTPVRIAPVDVTVFGEGYHATAPRTDSTN